MAKRMLTFCGTDVPEKAFPAFMLSSGALAMDVEVTMFFTFSGLNVIRRGGAEKITIEGAAKTMPEYVQMMIDGGATMIACSAAFPIVGIEEKDLIDGVECGGVASFVDEAEKSDIFLTFS